MNFYKHYIGDFQRDTNHLSLTERGAYLALIHHYYATETPLPVSTDALCRIAGAVTKAERSAVKAALSFFELMESGYVHLRIEAELEKAGEIKTRNRAIALAREEKRRRVKIGRKEVPDEHEKCTKRAQNVIPDISPDQYALSTPQTPDSMSTFHSEKVDPTGGALAGSVCARLKKLGIFGVNPLHPRLLALLKAGLMPDEIVSVAEEPVARGKGFAWILAAAEGRRRDAATVKPLPVAAERPWFLTASGIEGKAVELGISKSDDEAFPAFKARVYRAAGVSDETLRAAKSDFSVGVR